MRDKLITKMIEYIEENELTYEQFSSMIGTNKWTISRWLNGKRSPSPAYRKIIKETINN